MPLFHPHTGHPEVTLLKIERINENQVRFTLTKEDLDSRQMRLSELAYGTEKAKALFREMLQQAYRQVGFESDNTPLMIEAIPLKDGSIILVVTKVHDPEELDPRFSNFAPSIRQKEHGASAFEQLLQSLTEHAASGRESDHPSASRDPREALRRFQEYAACHRLYAFRSMNQVLQAADQMQAAYSGESTLYKEDGSYLLFLTMKDAQEVASQGRVLAAISEFGAMQPASYAREQYLEEHGTLLIADHAVEKLSGIARKTAPAD